MSDGSSLRHSWHKSLKDAEARFKRLLTSSSPAEWKRLSPTDSSSTSTSKGKLRQPEASDVVIHRRTNSKTSDDVYRLVLDVPIVGDEPVSLEPWHAVLGTPELRKEWDPAVEQSQLVEVFDWMTKVCKTNFTLGWPANPRDAVTISRTFHDATTVVYVSTSLPRSPDEPTYLRPCPPYVRSNVTLFAWCIQLIQTQAPTDRTPSKLRITCFHQHDLKSLWTNSTSTLTQQLATMTVDLVKCVNKRRHRVPVLLGSGNGVSLEKMRFLVDREALEVDYNIVPPDDEAEQTTTESKSVDEFAKSVEEIREQRRLTRSVECVLPSSEGWDVQVTTKASSEAVQSLPWSAHAFKRSSHGSVTEFDQIVLRITHSALPDDHSVLRVRLVVEISASGSRPAAIGLRLNGLPQTVKAVEDRDPSTSRYLPPTGLELGELATVTSGTQSMMSGQSASSASSSMRVRPAQLGMSGVERSAGAEKSVLSRVKRNYIYFSSLLQEPEAKWKRTTDARGVAITQLDSIDPTLVVYRAEATFVGVSMWDLYATLASPGAKAVWDKQHEDAILLEDVNELTELWQWKNKAAWPANARDCVVLRTIYRSPNTIHVFSFSIASDPSDAHLFPTVPAPEPNIIRTQVDLQGWAIEALSPTTTSLTLLEQSDPKGWANKVTAMPGQMVNTLAGIGEFAIKCGGPPIVNRLSGGRKRDVRYEHEKGSFRVEYEGAVGRRTGVNATPAAVDEEMEETTPMIECEIRCDLDTWASSLDVVIDPPPQNVACLRRHRMSAAGGGLWITVTHDAVFVGEERVLIVVRRGNNLGMATTRGDKERERTVVMVNGARVPVDVEEMPESEIKLLAKQKRVKPPRVPLDQPPVVGAMKKRKAEWEKDPPDASTASSPTVGAAAPATTQKAETAWASAPKLSSPLSRFFTYAVEQATVSTQQAVAAITPGTVEAPSPDKPPMQHALEAFAWAQYAYSHSSPLSSSSPDGWAPVSDKQGIVVGRTLDHRISRSIHVHNGSKVIQGVSAEEIAGVLSEYECRKKWDTMLGESKPLEAFGSGCGTAFVTSRTGFPFRDRGFLLANLQVRVNGVPAMGRTFSTGGAGGTTGVVGSPVDGSGAGGGARSILFHVSASYSDEHAKQFSAAKYNPYSLPIGRVFIDAWVLETLDPYTKENYAIPSTRCTRYVAMDYAGSIPFAANSNINATLPRSSILAVEAYIKGVSSLPMTRLPSCNALVLERAGDRSVPGNGGAGFGAAGVDEGAGWKLKKRDENRVLVRTCFRPEECAYRSTILLTIGAGTNAGSSLTPSASTTPSIPKRTRHDSQPTPRPSRMVLTETTFVPPPLPTATTTTTTTGGEPVPPLLATTESSSSSSTLSPPISLSTPSGLSASLRGRSASAAFTLKGEVRQTSDLIVGEIVLDSKLYPSGYDIDIRSRLLPLPSSSTPRNTLLPLSSSSTEAGDAVLPISYTVYTLPSSPHHSSDRATRHLVRLSLPTAQYQISTVEDPLTGETHTAPPKPGWLVEMQEKGVSAVVDVEIRSVSAIVGGERERRKGRERGVKVREEKESLTALGRDELLDERVGKMALLSRTLADSEDGLVPIPEELKAPTAVSVDLLDSASLSALSDLQNKGSPSGKDRDGLGLDVDNVTEESDSGTRTPQDASSHATGGTTLSPGNPSSTGLLGFFQTNPFMARFGAKTISPAGSAAQSEGGDNASGASSDGTPSGLSSRKPSSVFSIKDLPGGYASANGSSPSEGLQLQERPARTRSYPLSTLVIVALISFLMGSLLRSLVSPADFMYVTSEDATQGWREIRRLFEMKYVYGGWDFQVAIVRRQ